MAKQESSTIAKGLKGPEREKPKALQTLRPKPVDPYPTRQSLQKTPSLSSGFPPTIADQDTESEPIKLS